jgi:hypothetical protein
MVLQDLGRRINAAVSDLTRAPNIDEKVRIEYRVALPRDAAMLTLGIGLRVYA